MFIIRGTELLGMVDKDTGRSLFPETALHASDTTSAVPWMCVCILSQTRKSLTKFVFFL